MSKYPMSLRKAATVSLFFKDILELHFGVGSRILDPTCGECLLWKDIDTKLYYIKYSDIKNFGYSKSKFICCDYRELPKRYHGIFDGIVFDPPYLFGVKSPKDEREDTYGGYSQTKEELFKMISEAPKYLHKYLKPGGRLVLKCSDQYYSKEKSFYPLSNRWMNSFTSCYFKNIDIQIFQVHRASPTAWQVKNRNSSVQNYTYFFVFKRVDCD